jgi:hypothetical protein
MSSFNDKTKKSLIDLVNYDNSEELALKEEGKNLLAEVNSGADSFSKKLALSEKDYNKSLSSAKSNYLAATSTGTTSS